MEYLSEILEVQELSFYFLMTTTILSLWLATLAQIQKLSQTAILYTFS